MLLLLVSITLGLLVLGLAVGSTGWSPPWGDPTAMQIVWDIRAPRCAGAWLAGALLGLGGAIAQGLFRNPLADPYLLGSSSGAALGVAVLLALLGVSPVASAWSLRLGLTGAAFAGAVGAVSLTLILARGVQHTLRLLLAGVVVGVVLGALSALTMLMVPDIMRAMQAFMMGTTGFLGWNSVTILASTLVVSVLVAFGCSRALDALTLGDSAAVSLGVRLAGVRMLLIAAMALATGAAVAQAGLISFVGLVAPHLVRSRVNATNGPVLVLSALFGGVLLLGADIVARWVWAPQELPVGVLTAVLGGGYLLWRMNRGG
ncbi:MAG: iron ABC transporter permease [Aquabacterium sp.]|uniref:FecCD family ABC transporter permease n=1 Tax=Aquabacterium sp. TaxID=1872578 RepID=UPI0027264A88|nr:iron ABC transporter permease [Aquabacterium sp.]MDO9006443.1 iron ABC transporter permease [Aquabacterium sp.]